MKAKIDGLDTDELQQLISAVAESQNLGMANGILFMWVITDHPIDYPEYFVARAHGITGGKSTVTDSVIFSRRLALLQSVFEIAGLVKLTRHPNDENKIVEVWT